MSVFVPRNHEVTKSSLQDMYRTKLQLSLSKFLRSITHTSTQVRIEFRDSINEAPAYSNDKHVVLRHNPTSGSILRADSIVRLKGLAIHELSHLLFTPRSRTDLAKWVRSNNMWDAFNILEDNRIENMMVAKMSGIKPWLVHVITGELLSDTKAMSDALPLVWGRKYLPANVRTQALAEWSRANGSVIASILDQYIKLNLADTKQNDTAKSLIAQLHHELGGQQAITHERQQDTTPYSDVASTQSKRDQDQLLSQVEDDDTTDDENEDEGEGNTPATSSGLSDAIRDANANAAEQVYEDVKNTIQSVRDTDSQAEHASGEYMHDEEVKEVKAVAKYFVQSEQAMPEATVASRRFARELNDLRAQFDPSWLRKVDTGKLNVREFMMGADFDEMFDQWSDGNQDVTDIECVILLDNSGSMQDMITPAYNAMWSVKRALDSINATTTVIQFGSYGSILYSSDSQAGPTIRTARRDGGGGTSPWSSIKKAKDILDNSSRAIKMLLVITDGEWSHANSCDEIILTLRMQGVLTGLVFLTPPITEDRPIWWMSKDDNGNYLINGHKCEVVTHLDSPLKIVEVAKALTKLAQRKVLTV